MPCYKTLLLKTQIKAGEQVALAAAIKKAMKQGYQLGLAEGTNAAAVGAAHSNVTPCLLTQVPPAAPAAQVRPQHTTVAEEVAYEFATPVLETLIPEGLLPQRDLERLMATIGTKMASEPGDGGKSTQGANSWHSGDMLAVRAFHHPRFFLLACLLAHARTHARTHTVNTRVHAGVHARAPRCRECSRGKGVHELNASFACARLACVAPVPGCARMS